MKRRHFIQTGALASIGGGLAWPLISAGNSTVGPGMIREESKDIPVSGEFDVIVCGAGPAGVAAAIEAARNGARTLLMEANGSLGGIWTVGLLSWILDHSNKSGLMRELEERLDKMGAKCPVPTQRSLSFDTEKMKLLLENMCLDAGVEILLHTRVAGAVPDKAGRLTHVITESKSGREAWKGKLFIDTTGDGDLAAMSGCGFDFGNPEDNGSFQPMSLLAVVGGIHFDDVRDYVRWEGDHGSASKKRLLDAIISGGTDSSYAKPSLHPIDFDLYKLMANHMYGFPATDAREVTRATILARQEVHDVVNSLRSLGGPWANIRIVATGEHIGIREARRIHGLYTVTKEDLVNGVRHSDAVCRVGFGVDVHSVRREDDSQANYSRGIRSRPYDIPLRALIAKDVGGLMMAGRCISGDFISHSSYRVTGNSVATGEAAGRVCAIAASRNTLPQDLEWSQTGIRI